MKRRKPQHGNIDIDHHVAYALGHTEAWLGIYARSSQIPEGELTNRVATLLLAQAGGQTLGPEHHLSPLSGASTEAHQVLEPLEVAGRAPRSAPGQGRKHSMTEEERRKRGDARRRWWASLSPRKRKQQLEKMRIAKYGK